MSNNGIIDSLINKNTETEITDKEIEEIEIIVPDKCLNCKANVICSLIPSFIQMMKAGLIINVEKCPYFTEID